MRLPLRPSAGVVRPTRAPVAVPPPRTCPGLTATVTGTCSFAGRGTRRAVDGTISNGAFAVTGFRASAGTLHATGTLKVTCTAVDRFGRTVTGTTSAIVAATVTATVSPVGGSRRNLHLAVEPMDLDLFGLVVHTDASAIDVTAQSGPGNLLGNLLWTVANGLDRGAPATRLADLLNHVVAIRG